jgi:hypothetical protein
MAGGPPHPEDGSIVREAGAIMPPAINDLTSPSQWVFLLTSLMNLSLTRNAFAASTPVTIIVLVRGGI